MYSVIYSIIYSANIFIIMAPNKNSRWAENVPDTSGKRKSLSVKQKQGASLCFSNTSFMSSQLY